MAQKKSPMSCGADLPGRLLTGTLYCLSLAQTEFGEHALDEILGPAGWPDNTVGHRFAQLLFCGASLLRDREVLD
jgi:hypothetical protein